MNKKIMMLLVVLAAGVLLTGCTWFGGEEKTDEPTAGDLENVEVVDNGNNEEDVTEEVDEEESLPEDEEEVEDIVEEEEVEDDAVVDAEGSQSVGVGMVADGAVINGYSYEVAGGKLNFEWKVSANGDVYPKAMASRDSKNVITVIYPSLTRDSVAKEEKTASLGTNLPELTWMPSGEGSKYEFKYTSPKEFTLKTVDRGEEGRFIVISIDF